MSSPAIRFLLVLVLLSLVLDVLVVEGKKSKRNVERNGPKKQRKTNENGKEGKGKRWMEERPETDTLEGGRTKTVVRRAEEADTRRGGDRRADARNRVSAVEKQERKYVYEGGRTDGEGYSDEMEELPADEVECRSEKGMEEELEGERADVEEEEDYEPVENCWKKRQCRTSKPNRKGGAKSRGRTVLAHEASDGKCYYGV